MITYTSVIFQSSVLQNQCATCYVTCVWWFISTRVTFQCTMCTLYSFFSFRPSALGLIVQPQACHVIEHIFVPTHSVERNIEKSRFPWVSNSKFEIVPQMFPCSNHLAIAYSPGVTTGVLYSPVVDTGECRIFPRSNYGALIFPCNWYMRMQDILL